MSHFLWWYQSKSFLKFFKQWLHNIFCQDISSLIFSVHIVNLNSFFGNFLLNPEMSNFNVLCPCDGFDWAGNLCCTWIITENWTIFAIEDSFVNFVGKVDNILQEFYFCDSYKQSIKLSFCGASWDVILSIDQRFTREHAGSRSTLSCFFTESKIIVSEGEQFFTGPPCSELRKRTGSWVVLR